MLLPVLPLLVMGFMARLPPEVRAHMTPLVGPWKVVASDREGLADPGFDDTSWKSVELPCAFGTAGFPEKQHWLRRVVDLPRGDRSQFLLLGNIRWGIADLYVNGRLVGRNESTLDGYQPDYLTQQGWEIPPSLLNEGPNLLAMRISWGSDPNHGLMDSRMSIGPTHELRPYFVRSRLVSSIFILGSIAMCALLIVLLVALRVATPPRQRETRLDVVLFFVGAVLLYNFCNSGIFTLFIHADRNITVNLVCLALLISAIWFYRDYSFFGRTFRLTRINALLVMAAALASFFVPAMAFVVLLDGAFASVHGAVLLVILLIRRFHFTPKQLLDVSGLLMVGFAAIADATSSLSLHELPAVFPQSLVNLCVIA
jgi:hypothetical protein